MERRKFIQTLALSIASGSVGGIPAIAGRDQSWKVSFAEALKKKPWLLGFKGTSQATFARTTLRVTGTLPENLRGVFYRNGPAQHEIGDMRYHHFFDGDGMVHAFRFNGAAVTHEGRFVQTRKYREERAAGKAIEQGFGTALPFMRPPTSADAINVANINIIEHNGELLALWEGGSAYRIDSETLETLGLKSWSAETKGLPFSAHPKLDQDGTLWNFGYSATRGAKALVIYRIDANGELKNTGVHRMSSVPMVHDFMITKNYLVFLLAPFTYDDDQGGSFLDHFTWKPEQGGRALIVLKDDLSKSTFVEIPAFWYFHIANAYEDGAQNIRFQTPIYKDASIIKTTFKELMRGNTNTSAPHIILATGMLGLKNKTVKIETDPDTQFAEFPRIDSRKIAKKHRYCFLMQITGGGSPLSDGYFNTLMQQDNVTGAIKRYKYPDNYVADEHIFVPNPSSSKEGDGWMLGTTLNYAKKKSALNVFNAGRIEDGPVAVLELDYPIPLGLHGNFVQG